MMRFIAATRYVLHLLSFQLKPSISLSNKDMHVYPWSTYRYTSAKDLLPLYKNSIKLLMEFKYKRDQLVVQNNRASICAINNVLSFAYMCFKNAHQVLWYTLNRLSLSLLHQF